MGGMPMRLCRGSIGVVLNTPKSLHMLSPPRPGTNWANWSDVMGREMYLHRALDRLNFEYPSDNAA
jgi:hypothetical protein